MSKPQTERDGLDRPKIAVFQETGIRRHWHGNEWWFALSDVVAALTDTRDVTKLRLRDKELAQGWVHFVHTFSLKPTGPTRDRSSRVGPANVRPPSTASYRVRDRHE